MRHCSSMLQWTAPWKIFGISAPRALENHVRRATNFLMRSSREPTIGGTDIPAKRRSSLTSGRFLLENLLAIILRFGLTDTHSRWRSKVHPSPCKDREESSSPAIIQSPSVLPESPWYEMQSDEDSWSTTLACFHTLDQTGVW